MRNQLSLLNRQVGAQVDLKDVDMDCLDLINRHGPLSPTALARRAGLHPATMTGILDRTGQRRHWWSGCAPSPDGRLSHIRGAREGGA
jgi:DNA-binding MarR family transcriptional regulator